MTGTSTHAFAPHPAAFSGLGLWGRLLASLALMITLNATAQVEKSTIRFSQGWLFHATQAQFSLAGERGFWKEEGLDVTVDRGAGSATSVQRVMSGVYDIGYADVGTIIKWNAENPGRELQIFYIAEDGFPLMAVSLKGKGIVKPKDLEGRKIGAPLFDGGRQMFPAFAKANGIDQSKVTWVTMDASLRELMLVRGEVDAITGFVTSSIPTLNGLGIKTADLEVMRYDDNNLDGFGNALFATREFVAKHPKTVTAFVKGLNRAMKEMVSNPQAAIAAIKARDPLVNSELEMQRLDLYVKELLLTAHVRANGFSSVNTKKLENQIASVLDAFNVKGSMAVESLYTEQHLPPKADRIPPPYRR